MLSKKILEITLVQLPTHFLLPLMYLCHLVRLSSSNIVGYLKPGFFGTRPDLNPTFDIYLLLTFLCQCNSDVLVRDPKIQTTAGKTGFFGTRTRLLLLDYLTDYPWLALGGVGPQGWRIFFLLAPDDCLCMRIKTLRRFLVKSVTRCIYGHFKPQKWTFYRMIHFFTEVCQKLRIDE